MLSTNALPKFFVKNNSFLQLNLLLFNAFFFPRNFNIYRAGKKKQPMFFCSKFLNFWDTKTLILSKDRIFDIVFGGINFKMRQLLVGTHMAQNQKWQKKICSFLYPRAFFFKFAMFRVENRLSPTSNLYFGLLLQIPVILSYIAAGYDHFRLFYQNLKNGHF